MKVALVTSIPRGGPVEHALMLARDLRGESIDVHAVAGTPEVAARFAATGARVSVVALRGRLDAPGAVRLRRALRGADVVHSHDRRSGLWSALLPVPGAVRVHTIHGIPDPYLPPPVGSANPGLGARLAYRGLERWAAQRAEAIVVPSGAATDLLVAGLGYDRRAITVVANAVNPAPGRAAPGTLVGTIAALETVKGVDVFLRAAALLAAERPGLGFVVYGTGALDAELRALSTALGLGGRLRFAGHVPAAEALASLAVAVTTSHMETSGLAVLEAMAAGVPVVATAVGALPETAPPPAASLVPAGDAGAVAAAVAALLDSDASRAAQVRAGRALIDARGGSAAVARALLAVYRQALA